MATHGLTVKKIKAAKPTAKRQELIDPLLREFRLIVQPTGRRSFVVRDRIAGERVKIKVAELRNGSDAELAEQLEAARKRARQILAQIEAGEDPRRRQDSSADELAIEHVVAEFIADYSRTHRSADQVARLLRNYAISEFAGRRLDQIHPDEIRRLLNRVHRSTPIQSKRLYANLRVFFKWAKRQLIISVNPMLEIERPGEREISRDRSLADAELRDVWIAAGECDRFGQLVRFLILSAVRRNEAAGASRMEMDRDRHEWIIGRSRAKNAQPHLVPLTPALEELIDGLPIINGSALLFPAARGTRHMTGFGKGKIRLDRAIAELRQARGDEPIESWRLHDLRRSAVDGMARLGIGLEVRERCLGHHRGGVMRDIAGTYNTYDHADEVRAALERWQSHVAGLVSPHPPAVIKFERRHG